ncbi:GNAT family N-acetyltransferase [Roseobacter sp. CCS2]|uniref:GNAT family N-acetyltransferase n=1 Tax=Roseobacter sp. CCS2 TaxID=391593 RepID=UPI0000F400E1|nr:GNAT family N-acetyltransferase [Roseobacter sp. CCS2]EBA13547.1 GCN5-related N-acetyltransferase [Roseobacter sp. CCS2]
MIIVERTDPHHPQATALLKQSHALMESLFPPEDNFYLDVGDLVSPDIHFYTAREGETVLGTGALMIKSAYGEVKSMFVSEAARGKGIAAALLRQIEDTAREEGVTILKLETGNLLHAAHRLYARHGFTTCDVFGDYVTGKSSIFMEKPLT